MSTEAHSSQLQPSQPQLLPLPRVFVAFSGKTELRWLHCLRPGFRHCFALLNDGRQWLIYDPLAGHAEIHALAIPAGVDLAGWYRERGLLVLEAKPRRRDRQAPPALFTCVEAIKRLIGLHAPLILTPYQLFRHLSREQQVLSS
jgi:hypothetical protein